MHVECKHICAGRDAFSKGNGLWPPQPSHHHHLNECSSSRVISLYINYFLIWASNGTDQRHFLPSAAALLRQSNQSWLLEVSHGIELISKEV